MAKIMSICFVLIFCWIYTLETYAYKQHKDSSDHLLELIDRLYKNTNIADVRETNTHQRKINSHSGNDVRNQNRPYKKESDLISELLNHQTENLDDDNEQLLREIGAFLSAKRLKTHKKWIIHDGSVRGTSTTSTPTPTPPETPPSTTTTTTEATTAAPRKKCKICFWWSRCFYYYC